MFIKYIVIQWIVMVVIVVDGKSQIANTNITYDDIICMPECRNGYCQSPEKCACNPGYESKPTGTPSCLPVCDTPCTHGTCIAPNECHCDIGYRKTGIGVCEPVCRTGWLWKAGKCVAQCKYSCGNGTCVSPNQCICFPGYRIDIDKLLTGNIDAPLCTPVCTICKGICVAPNKCITEAVLTTSREDSCLDCGTEADSTSSIIYDDLDGLGNETTSYDNDTRVVSSHGPIGAVGDAGNTTDGTPSLWIKQHHVSILASIMGIILTAIVSTLLISRCKPALAYFIGKSYAVTKDLPDDYGDNEIYSLEDIELSDHKKT